MSRAYGWTDKGDAVVEDEATVIRMMATWLLEGGSLRGLTEHLKSEGIATAGDKTWQTVTIKRALTNPRMIGKKKSGDKLVDAEIPPILQTRTYNRLCKLLLDPERAKFTGGRTQVALLGGGIARCGGCGRALYSSASTGRAAVYTCSTRSGECPATVSVQAELLDADVTERVLARLSSPKLRAALTKSINQLGSRDEAEARIEDLQARYTALGEDFADGLIERETMRAGTDKVRANIAAIELKMKQQEVLDDLPEPTPSAIVEWWEQAGPRQRHDVVSILLDHVTVKPTDRRGPGGLDDERIEYVWKK
ncbi:recombinase family protein [Rhodococcus sp. IEGM 1379]|uniref:recombinase family protein n=1 Tax=Rhodococcus sp. IEGM 1379 TaxID=3047086 RepID=UPI0024B80F74|nr:recombinase family protein [Rhodococcus sp. IEGM 1379]MDI9914337.1 recombinase family protein [Rhodococcus sp. IEGM 1379]